jgi:hypothetical protein
MKARKCVIGAALAAMACSAVAKAADQTAANMVSLNPVYMDASTPTTSTPLMYLLEKGSVGKWMDDNKLSITGFVEGGYFYDTNAPRIGTFPKEDAPTLIGFPGAFSNRGLLDQADITFQKTIDSTKSWDFGFIFEGGYGTDDALIHSYGVLDNRAAPSESNKFDETSPDSSAGSPQNQIDLVQANVSVLVPIGSGVTILAGKFVTPFGYETINPINNPFYTHSYLFTFGLPLTQTGITGSYTFGKLVNGNDLTVTAGITRGWNESSLDNNGEVDFLGSLVTKLDSAGKTGLAINVSEGPETYDSGGFKGDSHNYWSVIEAIPSYQVSDQFKVAADLLYADFPHGSIVATNSSGGLDGSAAQWYSACLYAGYKFNNYVTLNGRAEWYRDQGGYTVGSGFSANYYEATAGVQIHPFPSNDILQWLQFRPEVRYDYSDHAVFNAAHNASAVSAGGDFNEFTVAMDAIMQF